MSGSYLEERDSVLVRVLITVLVLGLILAAAFTLFTKLNDHARLEFETVSVKVEIADTPEARSRGLSGRQNLDVDEGMLFVFDALGEYSFHMKDMLFAIDIIWLDNDLRVVDITADLSPESYPGTVTPSQPAKYVLEVNAGFAEHHEITAGSRAVLVGNSIN